MSAYFNTSTYPQTPTTPTSTSSLQISAPLTADIIKAGYVSIKDSWLWGKKYIVLRPVTLSMYKNERIEGGTPHVVISLNDVINLKREEAKDYCFSMEIRGGKIWLFSFKSDGELYGWMDEVYSVVTPKCANAEFKRCPLMGVSNPTNFTHKVHVGFDPLSGGFTGLPPEWARLLNASAITKEDYVRNPQAVIEVLEFYSKETARVGEMEAYAVCLFLGSSLRIAQSCRPTSI